MHKALSLTYGDAVRLLGGEDDRFRRLDRLLGLGLLAAAPAAPMVILALFETKDEIVSLLADLTKGIRARTIKATGADREELLIAAHAAIIIAAFIEELAERLPEVAPVVNWRKETRKWKLIPRGEPAQDSNRLPSNNRLVQIIDWSRRGLIEPPTPTRPLEIVIEDVKRLYDTLAERAYACVMDMARLDNLNNTQRKKIEETIRKILPAAAARRYRSNYIRLAGDVPEFLAWILVNDRLATRNLIEELYAGQKGQLAKIYRQLNIMEECIKDNATALAAIPQMFGEFAPSTKNQEIGYRTQQSIETIATHTHLQQAALDKPILKPELAGNLPGLIIPTVLEGYVNPRFLVADVDSASNGVLLAQERWWQRSVQSVHSSLAAYLVAHLTTPRATDIPLLVLGHPGSGKSLFSKVVAAQLPADRYVVARVELRHADPSGEVADQVDKALRRDSNRAYGWRELSDTTGHLTRVIILDGLDELLQLSGEEGLGRYLERVQIFQETEAALDRPTAVIVTCRTLVMDRVYVPPGTVVLKFEDFNNNQIEAWLSVWNRVNRSYFLDNELQPCSVSTVERQHHLAGQPLLLMMLALYDAHENALSRMNLATQADLYEALFRQFLSREIAKGPDEAMRPDLHESQIEQRFAELSAIAVGMFNRGRKFITRDEVERDLTQLGLHRRQQSGKGADVTADIALGQFFFLYQAEMTDTHAIAKHGYEFLHATFGEFLVARALTSALNQVLSSSKRLLAWNADAQPKMITSYLSPYLAHRPLVTELQVIDFASDICRKRQMIDRLAASTLLEPFGVIMPENQWIGDYRPRDISPVVTVAIWSLNLVLITLMASEGSLLLTSDMFDGDPLSGWRSLIRLWKSQLAPDDWEAVITLLKATVTDQGIMVTRRELPSQGELYPVNYPSAVNAEEVIRLILEARLSLDATLEAASSLWIVATSNLEIDYISDEFKILLARAFRFALGEDYIPEELDHLLTSLRAQMEGSWVHPIVNAGPTAWSDTGLMGLVEQVFEENSLEGIAYIDQPAENVSSHAPYAVTGRSERAHARPLSFIAAVLRELINRGQPNTAARALRTIRVVPRATESNLCDIAFLIQLAYAYKADALREVIGAAIPAIWRYEETADFISWEAAFWFATGRYTANDEERRVAPAQLLEHAVRESHEKLEINYTSGSQPWSDGRENFHP